MLVRSLRCGLAIVLIAFVVIPAKSYADVPSLFTFGAVTSTQSRDFTASYSDIYTEQNLSSTNQNHHARPWALGAFMLGTVLLTSGIVFGLSARKTASDWEEGCPLNQCMSGYTHARYLEDDSSLDRDRTLSNVLTLSGSAVLISALAWIFWTEFDE